MHIIKQWKQLNQHVDISNKKGDMLLHLDAHITSKLSERMEKFLA